MTTTSTSYHYYAFDAASLLETCIDHLQTVVELDTKGSHSVLYELKEALVTTERLLQDYFLQILNNNKTSKSTDDGTSSPTPNESGSLSNVPGDEKQKLPSLSECMTALRNQNEQQRLLEQHGNNSTSSSSSRQQHRLHHKPRRHNPTPFSRSVTDTLLFRLIVALQLCLVRIDDAHFVIAGFRRNKDTEDGSGSVTNSMRRRRRQKWLVNIGFCGSVLGVTTFLLQRNRRDNINIDTREGFLTLAKVGTSAFLCYEMANQWKSVWMASKLVKTTTEIEEWQRQWLLVESYREKSSTSQPQSNDDDKSKRLIEYVQSHSPKSKSSSFWISPGEIRFLIVRKAIEAYYSLTGADSDDDIDVGDENQQLPSYFCGLLQNSWGLVSRPAFKNFSMRASRLLRGASVADRIDIAGVPCLVISRHPCPELAAAIQRYHRRDRRRLSVQLSTIEESTPTSFNATIPKKLFAGTNDSYRQQDVILHCTGGGFFAHMIAFDLLYLLDWSASTGAVIICPEFSLLPEHPFPAALQEVTRVYTTLVSGDAVSTLGFEVNTIAVTGESTGGNLAAALCVNLCLDGDGNNLFVAPNGSEGAPLASSSKSVSDSDDEYLFPENLGSTSGSGSDDQGESCRSGGIRMPDALMISCAVLNMSLELSHSRVVGTEDPVLPSGVLSTISDAYLPATLGVSKTHYLASPMFAPASILARFPPTLLFASSNDPLLDDSIALNQTLRSLDVESRLIAVNNMPHAYWGLDLAGFPEAKRVHKEAKQWLTDKLSRPKP